MSPTHYLLHVRLRHFRYFIRIGVKLTDDLLKVFLKGNVRPFLEQLLLNHAADDVLGSRVGPVELEADRLLFAQQLALDGAVRMDLLHDQMVTDAAAALATRTVLGGRGRAVSIVVFTYLRFQNRLVLGFVVDAGFERLILFSGLRLLGRRLQVVQRL